MRWRERMQDVTAAAATTLAAPRMPLRVLAVAAASLLSAHCSSQESVPGELVARLGDIAGQWDIVSFNDHRPQRLDSDGQRHAFVDIAGNGGMSFTIGCNYSGMAGRIDEAGRLAGASLENAQVTTGMGCGPERERRDVTFFHFFQSRPAVRLSGDDLILATDDSQVVLQRPETRRAAALPRSLAELSGSWSAPVIYFQTAPGANRNLIAPLEGAPAQLEFGSAGARLSFDCETAEAAVAFSAPGALRFSAPRRRIQSACSIPQDDRDLVASLLSGAAEVEHIDAHRVHLVAGDVRAMLER